MNEWRMSVILKQAGDNIVVSTKASSTAFGLLEALAGSIDHEIYTRNFYKYLFRELNVNELPRNVVIENED